MATEAEACVEAAVAHKQVGGCSTTCSLILLSSVTLSSELLRIFPLSSIPSSSKRLSLFPGSLILLSSATISLESISTFFEGQLCQVDICKVEFY